MLALGQGRRKQIFSDQWVRSFVMPAQYGHYRVDSWVIDRVYSTYNYLTLSEWRSHMTVACHFYEISTSFQTNYCRLV